MRIPVRLAALLTLVAPHRTVAETPTAAIAQDPVMFVVFAALTEIRATLMDNDRFAKITEKSVVGPGAKLVRKFIQDNFDTNPAKSIAFLSVSRSAAFYQMAKSRSLGTTPLTWTSDERAEVFEFLRWYDASSEYFAHMIYQIGSSPVDVAWETFGDVAKNPLISVQQLVVFQGQFVRTAAKSPDSEVVQLDAPVAAVVKLMVQRKDELNYYAAKAELATSQGLTIDTKNLEWALRTVPVQWKPSADAMIEPQSQGNRTP